MRKPFESPCLLLTFVALATPALGQGTTISVIDLSTRHATAFPACAGPSAVAWAPLPQGRREDEDDDRDGERDRDGDLDGHEDEDDDARCPPPVSNVAYAVCDEDDTLVRIDLGTSPPTLTAAYILPGMGPSALAIDATGTRALVSGDLNSASYLDLTTTPFRELGPILTPIGSSEITDVAFYGTSRGLILAAENLYVVDLASTPLPGNVLATVALPSPGTAIAVDRKRKRAVVSLDAGGVQVVDLSKNALVGPELGEAGDTLGVAIAPGGTPAIAVYESSSETVFAPFALLVRLGPTPSVMGTVDLSAALVEPSAVAFNPLNGDALIAGDDGVSILKPPYETIQFTIRYPGFSGTTKRGIAASPDGTRALVVNEDSPESIPTSAIAGPAAAMHPRPAAKRHPKECGGHREHRDDRDGHRGERD
jgi:DNA-binding beta-propeller fold protein YncE